MPEKVVYEAEASSTGDGRNGHVRSTDGFIDTDLQFPPELGGKGGTTNPEQLFAAGYAACFHSAVRLVGERAKANMADSAVTARVGIGPDGPGFGLEVTLTVALPNVPKDQATKLIEQADQVCPYSRATRGNIKVDLKLA